MPMNSAEFRAALDSLGLSQVRAAKLFGASDKAARNWAAGRNKVPYAVAILLRLMVDRKIAPDDLQTSAQCAD